MTTDDELRTLRRRVAELTERLARVDPIRFAGSPALLCKTATVTSYPTSAGVYYAVVPVRPGGTEAEGATPSLSAGTGAFFALHLGSTAPPNGTYVLCSFVDGRWAFRYG